MSKVGKRNFQLRPAAGRPMESYTRERKAEFLLSNAVDAADYAGAVKSVKDLGLDSRKIKHRKTIEG